MGRRIRLWIVVASVVGLAALGAVSWLSYRNTKELIAANQRLAQTHKLIEDLTALHLLLDDAESSCRGYALRGKLEYLEPYDAALAQLDITTQVLRHDLAEDSNRLRKFLELEPLMQGRIEVMRDLVQARQTGGFSAAVQVVQSDRGRRLSDEIRQRISAMQTEERNDLLDREQESRQRTRATILAVGLTCLLGIALLLAASIVIYRLNRESEKDHIDLQNAERIQRTIVNSAAYSMLSTDTTGIIQTVNASAEKWLRYTGAELVGNSITILHDAGELQSRGDQLTGAMGMPVRGDYEALVAKATHGVPDEFECRYMRKDGTSFPVLLSVTALRSGDNQLAGYLMIAADLSERHAIRKMKDEFVSVVSHELRTPLTSIKGALGLLAAGVTGVLPPKAAEMANIAQGNVERLSRLVNDILDLQRIESGRITMDRRPWHIADLVKESVQSVHLLAEAEGVTILTYCCQASVQADRERMVQAFVNLLGNAIKFSPRGGGSSLPRNGPPAAYCLA